MRGERSGSLVYALDFEPNDLGSSPGRSDFVVVLSILKSANYTVIREMW